MPRPDTEPKRVTVVDFDLLSVLAAQLMQATTPEEALTAVSVYARVMGAARGILFFPIHNEGDDPIGVEVAAQWVDSPPTPPQLAQPIPVGAFYPLTPQDYELVLAVDRSYVVISEDVATDSGHHVDIWGRENLLGVGIAAFAMLALISRGRWAGAVFFGWATPHTFTDDHAKTLTALARQTAPVVDSLRLVAMNTARAARAERLIGINTALSHATNEGQIVEALTQCWPPGEPPAQILLSYLDTDEAGHPAVAINMGVWRGGHLIANDSRLGQRTPLNGVGLPSLWTRQPDTPLLIENFHTDPRPPEPTREAYLAQGVQALALLPLHSGGHWQGIVVFTWAEPHLFTTDERYTYRILLKTLPAVIGMRRAYLAEMSARREAEHLREQARTLAALEERNRLARELHDSVSQALYGIVLGARTARTLLDRDPARAREALDYVFSLADTGLTEMRALIFELRPEALANEGLVAALHKQLAAIQSRHGIRALGAFGEEPAIPLPAKDALYRIAREALHNVVKHARATQIMLTLGQVEDEIHLEIADDGLGFQTGGEFPGHLGLKSMQERAARLGGRAEISSAPGAGTAVRVWLPLHTLPATTW